MKTALIRVTLAGAVAVFLSACGDTVIRISGDIDAQATSKAGTRAFKDAGHPLKGQLACDPHDDEHDRDIVTCHGVTSTGQPTTLTVKLGDNSSTDIGAGNQATVDGADITGTVDGKQVFTKKCIGDC